MERIFLRRRIGVLFCIVGFLTILSAISYFFLQPVTQTAGKLFEERTLIIDPGHGGEDGGAVAADGTQEADINLCIAQRLRSLASFCGVHTVMTRSGESINYPDDAQTIAARKTADQRQRVEQINSIPNGVLLSIHQNWYPTASPHGAQVLYAGSAQSERLGTLMHARLVETLDPQNRRVAAPISEEIYLMRNAECPAVLVECGFLSNPEELARLKDSKYQLKLGVVLLGVYTEFIQTGWNE